MNNSGKHTRAGTMMAAVAALALGACGVPMDGAVEPDDGFTAEVPEQVLALAAPDQNLEAVRLMPDDRCYWYLHSGPVEDTMLPLLTTDGRMICSQPADAAA